MALNIIQKKTQHKSSRNGYKPIAIVIHISTASLQSCDNWFANSISKVSAHYCVGKSGEIHQYVDENLAAWHAGRKYDTKARIVLQNRKANPNWFTIGIEHEGQAHDEWTDAMYQASAELISDISRRWDIPIDTDHIIPHRDIYAKKSCPGFCVDLSKLISMARKVSESKG